MRYANRDCEITIRGGYPIEVAGVLGYNYKRCNEIKNERPFYDYTFDDSNR